MDWFAPINAYCERTDQSYWAEPINAISNLAFILAALATLWIWRRRGANDYPSLFLTAIALAVGIGSFLFHTHANRWSLLADVVPIMLFIYAYFFFALRRMLGLGVAASIGVLVGYFFASFGFGLLLPAGFLSGSGSYLPALFALVGVGALLHAMAHPSARELFVAAGIFAVSLTFRTMDQAACEAFPVGTHFLWHMLNGLLLFILIRAMMMATDLTPALAQRARAVA